MNNLMISGGLNPTSLKNMSSSIGMMTFPIDGKKYSSHHQPVQLLGKRVMERWLKLGDVLTSWKCHEYQCLPTLGYINLDQIEIM